jgi:hypothetical protein
MSDQELSSEVVVLAPEEIDHLEELAERHGVAAERLPQYGFEPVATAVFVLTGTALAVATVTYLIDRSKGGQVIDLRPGAPKTVYRSTDVTYGLVVLISADGSVRVEVREPKGMFGPVNELITGAIGELIGKDVATVHDTVTRLVDSDVAEVTATPTSPS